MKTVSETINRLYKRVAVLVIAVACTTLYACGDKAGNDTENTEADANSQQDTFKIRTDEGAGFSMDTSATTPEGMPLDSVTSTSEPRREFKTQDKAENKAENEKISPEKAKGQGEGNQ
ncbi:MAG: hypothetical protein ICV83_21950 [Cytophagales bacterium]|nr:hypothetical protein [Cytophagales bacterium]